MWLLIDIKGTGRPDWEGFNFIVNRRPSSTTETSVEICTGAWNWKSSGTATYRIQDNQMQLAVPRKLLELHKNQFTIEFKWIDNTQSPGDIIDLYTNGDSAPGGRFRYRYDRQLN